MTNRKVDILDCTIRDGSYAIDYSFTLKDIVIIGKNLEKAGFRFIEIGHGVGLGGSPQYGKSIATDEEYCKIASSIFKKAKWGMFFIPGIGTKEHLDIAVKYGMDFVRIGTNVTEVAAAEEYIKYAKKLGLFVASNLMKSYAVSPEDFALAAKKADQFGVDVLYLVDSAGCMFPDDISRYITAAKKVVSCKLGFHGHNNLSMASINSLEAVNSGCDFVDSSLQGLGRSSGNAETEVLTIMLEKYGYNIGVNMLKTLSIGDQLVKPIMQRKGGLDEIGLICGYAQFHSSFKKIIDKFASQYGIDPRILMIETAKINKIAADPIVVEELAKKIKKQESVNNASYRFDELSSDELKQVFGYSEDELEGRLREIIDDVNAISKKKNKKSIFTIAVSHFDRKETKFPFVRENSYSVIGNIEVNQEDKITDFVPILDGAVDYILLDTSDKKVSIDKIRKIKSLFKKSHVMFYNDVDIWIDSISACLTLSNTNGCEEVLIVGLNAESKKLIFKLLELGFIVSVWDKVESLSKETIDVIVRYFEKPVFLTSQSDLYEAVKNKDFIIGMTHNEDFLVEDLFSNIDERSTLIDGSLGSINEQLIDLCRERGNSVYRFDLRASLSGNIISLVETYELMTKILGYVKLTDFNVVAGGFIGKKGDIVVDSICEPTRVLGVADGQGYFLNDIENKNFEEQILKTQKWIIEQISEIKEVL